MTVENPNSYYLPAAGRLFVAARNWLFSWTEEPFHTHSGAADRTGKDVAAEQEAAKDDYARLLDGDMDYLALTQSEREDQKTMARVRAALES